MDFQTQDLPANSNFEIKKNHKKITMSGNSKALASKLCLASAKKFQYVLTNSTLPDYCVGKDMSKEEMNEFLPEFFKFLQEQGVKGECASCWKSCFMDMSN